MNKRRRPGLLQEIRDVLIPEDKGADVSVTCSRLSGSWAWRDPTITTNASTGNWQVAYNLPLPASKTYTLNGSGTAEDPYNITIS